MPFELIAAGFFVAGILVGMAIMYAQGLMADANERHDRLMAAYDRSFETSFEGADTREP